MPPFSKTIRSSASIFHLNIEKKNFWSNYLDFLSYCVQDSGSTASLKIKFKPEKTSLSLPCSQAQKILDFFILAVKF